mgnify:CR=1 FL=1
MELLKNSLIDSVVNTQADGTGTTSSDILDMANHCGVLFVCKFGDVTDTAVLTLQAQQDTASGGGTMATLTGTATFTAGATDGDDKLLILDVVEPRERYIRAQVVVATANAVIESVTAIRYGARKKPFTQGSDVVGSNSVYSPAEA